RDKLDGFPRLFGDRRDDGRVTEAIEKG
ncbi:MAG: hypothetical protein QOI55_1435, partial [Actinomycetota bacterium]|nr:hypothetical protein [Actinomycetota bacterium]